MAKTKVKKAVKRAVGKKVAAAPKVRAVKAAKRTKTAATTKTLPKAASAKTTLSKTASPKAKKTAKKPAVVIGSAPAPEAVVVAPLVESAKAPASEVVAPAARPEILTVKRPTAAGGRVKTTQRADLPPTEGYTLLVDGHFKNGFEDPEMARAAATKLLSKFPKLRIEIYDAVSKTRTRV
ncbi:hypothetical protein X566_16825 [Afipia sp. P52-10]|uniref:hypothetical protein n=1 Tax=Afipia sp. P52-10 TaxID=1429916 RepID=UPI0003DF04EA|nr:hypothetical protein [Afipia sp. P52-10]ETR76231.1 hypothetical protein X566_16825 [Afipia sp. P52-10]